MNELFQLCVGILYRMSHLTGIRYEAFNILLFVIIQPLIIMTLSLAVIYLGRRLMKSNQLIEKIKSEYTFPLEEHASGNE